MGPYACYFVRAFYFILFAKTTCNFSFINSLHKLLMIKEMEFICLFYLFIWFLDFVNLMQFNLILKLRFKIIKIN